MSVLESIAERILPSRDRRLAIDADEFFDLVTNPRRRYVLGELAARGRDEPVRFSELANELAADETGKSVGEITEAERKRCYVSLYQTHLHRLNDAGLLVWHTDDATVRANQRTVTAAEIVADMEAAIDERRRFLASDVDATEFDSTAIYELLTNERRRHVVSLLADADAGGQVTLSDIAEHVATIENDCSRDELGSKQRKRVYVGLYQCHLPKFDGYGVIDFDTQRKSGRIIVTGRIEPVWAALRAGKKRLEEESS